MTGLKLLPLVLLQISVSTQIIDLQIIEKIRACGERAGIDQKIIPKICYENPDATLVTPNHLSRGRRSNLLFRGHHQMCKMPCQRVPLYMDANLLGRQFGIFLKNYDGSKLIDIGSCRGHCMAFQNPLGSDIQQGCFPSKMETLDFESNGFVFQNEMIVKTCRCASFISCHQ